MTYEELQRKTADLKKQADELHRQQSECEQEYIDEHEPFKTHRYMRLKVRLRVTEKTRDTLTDAGRRMKKYQLGHEYTASGCFIGWHICMNRCGELRPCFFGGATYSQLDEIVSIEPDRQIDGHCSKCRMYKDGYCYMMGGKEFGVEYATHKVKADDYTCPRYEELTELWNKSGDIHYPNVAICKHKNPVAYRIYSRDWAYYTEWSQESIDSNYTAH